MLKTFMKPQQVGILIVILFVSVAHIGTTDHICELDADSWILPEEGIWPFSYYQGSEVGASMDIKFPQFLEGKYVPGIGITVGRTTSRGKFHISDDHRQQPVPSAWLETATSKRNLSLARKKKEDYTPRHFQPLSYGENRHYQPQQHLTSLKTSPKNDFRFEN